jgi:hypothetical protein
MTERKKNPVVFGKEDMVGNSADRAYWRFAWHYRILTNGKIYKLQRHFFLILWETIATFDTESKASEAMDVRIKVEAATKKWRRL